MGLVKRKNEVDTSKEEKQPQSKETNAQNNKSSRGNKQGSNSKKHKKSFYDASIQNELKCIFQRIKKSLSVQYTFTNQRYKISLGNKVIFDVNVKAKTVHKIDDIFISTYLNALGISKDNNFINITATYNDRSSIVKITDISSISVMEYEGVFVLEISTHSNTFLVNLEKGCDLKSIVIHRSMLPYIYEFITQQTSFSDQIDGFFEIPQDL